jgi:hypothetical protein
MTPPRVLLLDPYGDGAPRGNSVSTARVVAGLEAAGCAVRRLVALKTTLSAALRAVQEHRPDVLHAIHAFRAGPMAREVAVRTGLPFVVSFRGTDAAAGLEHR